MVWHGRSGGKSPEKAITMVAAGKVPLIAEFTARRLVDANALTLLVNELGKSPAQLTAMLNGLLAGLEGRSDIKAPASWETVYRKLKSQKSVAPLALEVAQLFGDSEAAQKYLATLKMQLRRLKYAGMP